MNADTRLLAAMLGFVRGRFDASAAAVTAYREQQYRSGYCQTCADSSIKVMIWWVTGRGAPRRGEVDDDLTWFIRELTSDPAEQHDLTGVATFAVDRPDFDDDWPHKDSLPPVQYGWHTERGI
jgi:hypothetical protein